MSRRDIYWVFVSGFAVPHLRKYSGFYRKCWSLENCQGEIQAWKPFEVSRRWRMLLGSVVWRILPRYVWTDRGKSKLCIRFGGFEKVSHDDTFVDWVCGGQWDKMEQFLQNFSRVIHNSNLDLVIFFNGTLEYERIGGDAARSYQETLRCLEEITKHVATKRKPPPKVWWIPPAYLRSAIRQTLRIFDIKVVSFQVNFNLKGLR